MGARRQAGNTHGNPGRARTARRRLLAAAAVLAVCCAAVLLCAGCRDSDELVEVVYTQDAATVDTEVDQKNYELASDADRTVDLDETTDDVDDDAVEHIQEEIPVFGVPATTDEAIEQVLYDENAGTSRTAPIFPEQPREYTDDQELADEVSDEGNEEDEDEEGNDEGDDAGMQESDDAERGVSMHTDAPKVYNASGGLLAPLENVRLIATVGEYANLALMLGGPGTLAGADSGFLENKNAQRVFSAEEWEFDAIPVLWTVDEGGDYVLDFDALVEADPDLVWVPDGMDLLTDEQEAQLLELGINVEPAPAMSSVSAIEEMATWLGGTLGSHTVSGKDAAAAAASYVDTYLGSDIDALISENGGLTTYGDVDYSGGGHAASSTSNWTVLVTDWDDEATFNAGIWTAQGVAIATAGYGWSPVDYYLSVGGVNNNAAQFPNAAMAGKQSADYYVWQFNMSMLDPSNVIGVKAVSDFGETSYGWTQCLVGAPASVDRDATFTTSLGADDFRYVICTTRHAAEALAAARDADTASQTGLYAAYDYSVGEALQESGVGPRTADGVLIRAIIGSTGTGTLSIGQQRTAAGENPYEVVTCANGLYCDWVAGSAESFLMAFWTDDFYDSEGTDFSNLDEEARRFYEEFYGYELTGEDLEAIHAGREA